MTDQNTNSAEFAEFEELSAGHAVRALSATEAQRFTELRVAHPEWEATARADATVAARLGEGVLPVEPPAAIRAQLLAQIAGSLQTTSQADDARADDIQTGGAASAAAPFSADAAAAPEEAHRRRSRRGRLFALAASLVLLGGIALGTVALTQYLTRPAAVVALDEVRAAPDAQSASVDAAGVAATAYWSAEKQKAVLVAEDLQPLSAQQSYELWFVREGVPISAGVFEVESGTTTALLDGDMHSGDVIAVTVEVAGGSPTGQPTSDPVIAIPTA
ncbi:anti-sigma-K factor RskA [Microbacterium keratanolyticum]|uniref:Anti-sigma K factor RskA C-terminal domain-containing protein n=1 Tax=Microbacterium keratanolyticum TaxID=67574 RepID=A0A9W6HSQ1_9MICO|nr:anti-sigma factor [Microbacterium keratanolyticum]MBM7469633.1 anti-sigma-K factor RskA [Microbacterium keratanolyticum]GLK01712.1 hypothetical protein GCM10017596_14270 [Microbacterium keratanolyticum]